MFGLGIRYLNGWAMAAADGARKEIAEWPQHPDRVFMALAAAWFETGKDKTEGEVLQWLEQLGPPGMVVPNAEYRSIQTSFVPINDNASPIKTKGSRKKGDYKEIPLQQLGACPIGRDRQPRSFPVAIPWVNNIGDIPEVYLIWNIDIPKDHYNPLENLCTKVVSLGCSASLVQMWLTREPPEPTLVPTEGMAKFRLRVFGKGRLSYLEARMNKDAIIAYADLETQMSKAKGREKARIKNELIEKFPQGRPVRLRPEPGFWQGYDIPASPSKEQTRGSIFDPRIVVLALSGKRLGLHSTLKITEALRNSLLSTCLQPIPEWISGHTPEGKRSERPHIAMFPLPFVGREHADGRLMGLALAVPRAIDPKECDGYLVPWLHDEYGLPKQIRLFDGKWFECNAEMEMRDTPPLNLQPEMWTTPSKRWATVTPVVLDRHFDGSDKWEKAAETIKDSCERIGLPRPIEVILSPVSMFEGVPRSNEFPWMSRKNDGGRMHHTHAVIIFEEKVQGYPL